MEVYLSNLDSGTHHKELYDALSSVLLPCGIRAYDVRKKVGKTFDFLTLPDPLKANKFLSRVQDEATPLLFTPLGKAVQFQRNTKRPCPDIQLLRVLQKEEKDLQTNKASNGIGTRDLNQQQDGPSEQVGLHITTLQCGLWETSAHDKRVFTAYFDHKGEAKLVRSRRELTVKVYTNPRYELVIDLNSIASITMSSVQGKAAFTITLNLAPKFYQKQDPEANQDISAMFDFLAMSRPPAWKQSPTCLRDTKLPDMQQMTVGSCLAYRMLLAPEVTLASLSKRPRSRIFHQIPVVKVSGSTVLAPVPNFQEQINRLDTLMKSLDPSFGCKFQVQALWSNGLLSPNEIVRLIPLMASIKQDSGEKVLVKILQRLTTQLRLSDVQTGGFAEATAIMTQQSSFFLQGSEDISKRSPSRGEVKVHRVVVTPAGVYLYGPEDIAANRILRQHRKNQDHFLRVSFTDEAEDKIQFDRETSNERIFTGRFLTILRNGLDIAGEHFDFLGFSNSSLRSQTCWFMSPFIENGSLLFARALIKSLGDFSNIRIPAKCAARIGQAFSETTSAIRIDPSIVFHDADIENGQYVFTDGCGTVSESTWRRLKNATSTKAQPTLYQIRYKGAKGMISLDTRLEGHQMRLRNSMVKFTGSPANDIEICGNNSRALPLRLNHQMIKILEDLDIEASTFEGLQYQAVEKLRASATSLSSALDFLKSNLFDSATSLPALLKALTIINIDVTDDTFIKDILGALIQVQLRELKYRSRILVPLGITVLGISDETGYLQEGQVFVTYFSEELKAQKHLQCRIAVTRSPALHPGDIQVATAVSPLKGSCLWKLTNCIVFSRHGHRDLPSMLSGGDLDGDHYQVIFDPKLIPRKTYQPADYQPAKPMDIGRAVTTDDMTEFFIDFMQNDQVGRIATLHKVLADGEEGTRSIDCLKLAALHSTAVDFSKTGIKVDVTKIPKAPEYRPDFMAPSASTKVEKGIHRPQAPVDMTGKPDRFRYYESYRVLGRLYRAIDEDIFFQDLADDASSVFSHQGSDNVLKEIWRFVRNAMIGYAWEDYTQKAIQLRDHYELNLLDVMSQYATARTDFLTEKEVFIGTIIGRSGAGSISQREQSEYMKGRFNRDLREIKSWMEAETSSEDGKDEDEFLCLATACLYVAVERASNVSTGKLGIELRSFGWFAAGMCVPVLVNDSLVT